MTMLDVFTSPHAFLGQRLTLFVASLVLFGCPAQPEPASDAGYDQGSDASVDVSPDASGDRQDASSTEDASEDAADEDAGVRVSVAATLSPVALGLGGSAPAPVAFTLTGVGTVSAEVTWPPGAWRLALEVDGQAVGVTSGRPTGLRRDAEAVTQLGDPTEAAVLFNPCDEPVRVSYDLAARALTIARTVDAPEPSPDALPGGCAGAGVLFDDAIFAVNTAEGDSFSEVTDLLDALRVRGLAPLATSRGTLFVAPGSPDEPKPQLRGDLNGWEATPEHTLEPLTRRLYTRFVEAPVMPSAYKLVYGDGAAWFTDPSNPSIQWDGVQAAGVGEFNSILARGTDGPRLVWLPGVESPELGNRRDVYVWLPGAYATEPDRRFPVLYLHDGNESLSRSQLDAVAAEWVARDPSNAFIAVFAHLPAQDVRLAEYTFGTTDGRGDAYAEFVARTLVPYIDARFRTLARPGARGVAGASLGGLISYRIATQYPDVFEYAAGISSSFWWEDRLMVDELRRLGCQDLTYYLDSGAPGDGVEGTRAMRDALVDLGCTHTHVEEPGASHDWFFWKRRFPGLLDAFHMVFVNDPME